MSIPTTVKALIQRHGQMVTLEGQEPPVSFRAMIQPIRSKGQLYVEEDEPVIGHADILRYTYFGPCDDGGEQVGEGTVLRLHEEEAYTVVKCRTVWMGDRPVYRWALLAQAVREEAE